MCCVLFMRINMGRRSVKLYYLSRVCGQVSRRFTRKQQILIALPIRCIPLSLLPLFAPRAFPFLLSIIMANAAGRKKSIVSNPGLVIETPVANNNILNKAASASTSLYQQCSSLRARLMRIPNFSHFFILSSPNGDLRQSTDPVTQLWDCFTLGIPLCFLFNLLPPPTRPIGEIITDPAIFDVSNEKEKKRAIAKFAMRLSEIDNCERFTVSDLWDRHSTDGLVKVRSRPLSAQIRNLDIFQVVSTVTTLVDLLPSGIFEPTPMSPSLLSSQESIDSFSNHTLNATVTPSAHEAARNNIVREMVETERKYVQDLEVMQVICTSFRFVITHLIEPEICDRIVAKQYNRPGYHPLTLPRPEQVIELPKKVPYSPRKHSRTALERTALGYALSREREPDYLLFQHLTHT